MKGPWKVVLALLLGLPALVGAQPCNSTKGQLEYCNALTDAVRFGFPRYTTALLPTCGTSNKGAVAYDTTANLVKYCTGSAWTSVGAGGGVSGLTTGKIPKAASATSLTDSLLSDDGTNITLASGKLIIQDHLWFGPSSASNSELYCPLGGTTCTFETTNGAAFVPITVEGLRFRTDLKLERDAANILALRNSTNAQRLNVYNTYIDASNYERGIFAWVTNELKIGTESLGTGSVRGLRFYTGTNGYFYFEMPTYATLAMYQGNFYPTTTDAASIGSSTTLFKGAYLARSIQGSKTKALTEGAATAVTQIAVPQTAGSNSADAVVQWTVYASDGTDTQTRRGSTYLAAVNAAGTETCTVGDIGTPVVAVSAGTLTCTTSCITGLTDVVQFALDCTSSLTQTTLNAMVRLDMDQPNTVTPQ